MFVPHLSIVEGLGPDGEAAQVNSVLEALWQPQHPQLLVGRAGQLVGSEVFTLLGQGEQGGCGRVKVHSVGRDVRH